MTEASQKTVECPECGRSLTVGEQAKEHARGHWLSNPNIRENDLKGEARKRYEYLMGAN